MVDFSFYWLPVGCFLVRHHLVFFWKPPSESVEIPDYHFSLSAKFSLSCKTCCAIKYYNSIIWPSLNNHTYKQRGSEKGDKHNRCRGSRESFGLDKPFKALFPLLCHMPLPDHTFTFHHFCPIEQHWWLAGLWITIHLTLLWDYVRLFLPNKVPLDIIAKFHIILSIHFWQDLSQQF